MDVFLVTGRLALATVFVVAALGKAIDVAGTRQALGDFRVPAWLIRPGAVLLPCAEAVTALGLIFAPTARPAAVLAAVLLLLFAAAIGRAVRDGEAPQCHCFGQIHSAPAGPVTLGRNLGLAVLAVIVAFAPSRSVSGVVSAQPSTVLVLAAVAVLAALLAAACVSLWAENRRLRTAADLSERVTGLAVGSVAPGFTLPDRDGREVTLAQLLSRELPVVLVFVHSECVPCNQLLPDLDAWLPAVSGAVTVAAVSAGRFSFEPSSLIVLEARGFVVADAYGLMTTPSAVLIDQGGMIASRPALGPLGVEELVRVTARGTESIALAQHALEPAGA